MDTSYAKIVTDLDGRDHMLIEGRIISLHGATNEVNAVVDAIVRGLPSVGREFACREMVCDQQTAGTVAAAVGA